MSEIICNHCGKAFDDDRDYCPSCRSPTPAQQDKDFASLKKKIILYFIGLAIFCAIMILWLPRYIP
jgi:predicted amidophosphoribosyltransferase